MYYTHGKIWSIANVAKAMLGIEIRKINQGVSTVGRFGLVLPILCRALHIF